MKYIYVIIILAIFSFNHCYYDSEENLYPEIPGDCDTTNIAFNSSIRTILSANCWACHSNANANVFGNNLALQDFSQVVNLQNNILGSIQHKAPFSPMPKNGSKLSACSILQFELWIQNSSPEN